MSISRRTVFGASLGLALAGEARAQAVDTLQLFVPAAPGGGWDQTARTIEMVLRANNAARRDSG